MPVYVPKIDEHFVGSLAVIPLAANGILCQCGERTGCRQTKKSGKESVTVGIKYFGKLGGALGWYIE